MHAVDLAQTAEHLQVSASWIRRHLSDLPAIRRGRLLRFDSDGLKLHAGKSLKSERVNMTPRRYQRGSVFLDRDVWKGMFRVDTPDGKRKQKKITLGTRRELPNKTDARDKLAEVMKKMLMKLPPSSPEPAKSLSYSAMVGRWKASEGVTLGLTTLAHYANALRSTVLPTLADRTLDSIQREDSTQLLNSQAKKYSFSSLRSMRW